MAFTVKQNDTSPSIQVALKDADSTAIPLEGATARFIMKLVGGVTKVDAAMNIVDAVNGIIQYDWATGDTDTVGVYYLEFRVTYVDGSIESFPNSGNKALNVVRGLQ
jgi:hypothetical protein